MTADQSGIDCTRHRFDATVQVNEPICREHYRLLLRVRDPFPPTKPGMFIELGCREPMDQPQPVAAGGAEYEWTPSQPPQPTQRELVAASAMLRRPFSLAGRDGQVLEIIHRVVGVGTQWLASLQPGDEVDLIGPLGNSFTLPPDKDRGLLVGGGVGLPPMFYLAQWLHDAGWEAVGFVGARTRDLLAVRFVDGKVPPNDGKPTPDVEEFARFGFDAVVTTDDGSLGLQGTIVDGLERYIATMSQLQRRRTVVFVCGPNRMMQAVAESAARSGLDCQACLEQAMACGMGTCQSCVVRIEDPHEPQGRTADGRPWRYRLTCTDGPVFDARDVVW